MTQKRTVRFSSLFLFSLLFCTLGIPLQKAYAQDKAVQLFAHRGGAHEQDENTLQAFQNSYEKGLRGFETDVRISKDGQLIISHDASLDRMTTSQGIVEEMTAAELRKVKTKKGNPLLFLDDLLAYFADKPVYLEFEMKTNPKAYPRSYSKNIAIKCIKPSWPKNRTGLPTC